MFFYILEDFIVYCFFDKRGYVCCSWNEICFFNELFSNIYFFLNFVREFLCFLIFFKSIFNEVNF